MEEDTLQSSIEEVLGEMPETENEQTRLAAKRAMEALAAAHRKKAKVVVDGTVAGAELFYLVRSVLHRRPPAKLRPGAAR